MRRIAPLIVTVAVFLVGAPTAGAQVEAFNTVECEPNGDVRFCEGDVATRVETFDGVPLDVNVTLPAPPADGEDGPYPLVVVLHGYGGDKLGLDEEQFGTPSARALARDGYAVLSYTARGFGDSCGSESSRAADPEGCEEGWVRLADSRYEVRDTQHLAGLLADQGLAAPRRIAVTGVSYGGGQSLQLATLRDRIRRPDGSYAPWRSPHRQRKMEIAAAVPVIPWSDLAYSLTPNGRTVDYLVTGETDDFTPVGVLKQSFTAGLYALGEASGYYAPPGADPDADLTSWFTRVNAGEPYDDAETRDIVEELTSNHSAYYLRMDRPPAPILISNGFTDDLFPVDEALRYYNKVSRLHPRAPYSQLHFDYGHQRGSNKDADIAHLGRRIADWLDRYVKGEDGVEPLRGVEALTQTCPAGVPSGGPFRAPTWRALHPGEVRFRAPAPQTIASEAGDPMISAAVDPVAAGNDPCGQTPADDQQGTATYRLPVVGGDGYTLLGSPTVIANFDVTAASADDTQIAARLWDVAADGSGQRLVARAVYRPDGDGRRVFQLHPNGYHFAPGHTVKLELLGSDAPYARESNPPPFTIEVSNLDFRLPVAEAPGTGQVGEPATPFVPSGGVLAPEYEG